MNFTTVAGLLDAYDKAFIGLAEFHRRMDKLKEQFFAELNALRAKYVGLKNYDQ